jgi:hypothetical protein
MGGIAQKARRNEGTAQPWLKSDVQKGLEEKGYEFVANIPHSSESDITLLGLTDNLDGTKSFYWHRTRIGPFADVQLAQGYNSKGNLLPNSTGIYVRRLLADPISERDVLQTVLAQIRRTQQPERARPAYDPWSGPREGSSRSSMAPEKTNTKNKPDKKNKGATNLFNYNLFDDHLFNDNLFNYNLFDDHLFND